MRKIECPFLPGAWIGLPDEWLGKHLQRRDQAVEKAKIYDSNSLTRFAASLALLEDWGGLPGLDGNPDKWDFARVSARVINWITFKVDEDFLSSWIFPETSLPQSTDGSSQPTTTPEAPGDLKTEVTAPA